MSFDAIIRGTWSPEEIAELRTEAEWWESYDGLPVEGWEPGACLAEMDTEITLDLYERIREAQDGYRSAMESLGIITYGEVGYGKSWVVPPDDTVLYEGSFGPVYMGLDDYEMFLYGEEGRPDEEEDE